MTDESDHDILIELRTDMKYLVEHQKSIDNAIYGSDGTGGLCGRIQSVEQNQNKIIGAAGVVGIAAGLFIPVINFFRSLGQ